MLADRFNDKGKLIDMQLDTALGENRIIQMVSVHPLFPVCFFPVGSQHELAVVTVTLHAVSYRQVVI
jgi:hypothetical protein